MKTEKAASKMVLVKASKEKTKLAGRPRICLDKRSKTMNPAPIIEENLQQIPANPGKGKGKSVLVEGSTLARRLLKKGVHPSVLLILGSVAAPTSNQSLVGKLNTLTPDASSIMSGICERIFIEVPHLVIRTAIGSEPLPLVDALMLALSEHSESSSEFEGQMKKNDTAAANTHLVGSYSVDLKDVTNSGAAK
ncbi:hypothetical protein C1H46_004019 [Malus baccata]|uniref:Uncharacterized protein n=1 Tax=Malus baccata TaxID=106549 RepID=A0A540NHA5_MALBA|nr:hypothetical protein C1H46_004019 [Malus baccata]